MPIPRNHRRHCTCRAHARWIVRTYSGSVVLRTEYFTRYSAARGYARNFTAYPTTIRPQFTDRECLLLVSLVWVSVFAMFAGAL